MNSEVMRWSFRRTFAFASGHLRQPQRYFKASAVCHTPGALQGARVGIIFLGDHEPQPACVVGSRKHARVRGRTLDNDSDVAKDDQWTGREVHSVSQSF
jgi:hypothetical protein